jgi:hypothetical protein
MAKFYQPEPIEKLISQNECSRIKIKPEFWQSQSAFDHAVISI